MLSINIKSKQAIDTMKTNYTHQACNFVSEIISDIYPLLLEKVFEEEIDNKKCRVEILSDDISTILVKWGDKYNGNFFDLPTIAMATLADLILKEGN